MEVFQIVAGGAIEWLVSPIIVDIVEVVVYNTRVKLNSAIGRIFWF